MIREQSGPVGMELPLQALEEIRRIQDKYRPILRQLEPMHEEIRAVMQKYGMNTRTQRRNEDARARIR